MALALVTGSTHRLGAHIAARLGEAGFAVALHASRPRAAEDWLTDRLDRAGAAHHCFAADLAEDDACDRLVAAAADHFAEPVAMLVNNASMFAAESAGPPDMATLDAHFRVNTAAPFLLAHAVARGLGEGTGAVVNILDQRIRNPHGDQQAYTLSKQALAEATRLLAATLAPRVRVNGVAPGLTLATADYDAAQVVRLKDLMPLRCLSAPDDVADAVLYFAHARATTGQILYVDGGAAMTRFDRDFVHLAR
ncbi:SDR family oxidoreductase [Stakelama saccharophila]|uniref:SDR family oxidoreductase n=1 Tax=Stakelama saccharophila TaxID=3075605 RepID=A0ABZ0B8N5_9SPHN|nr:SDR family oxidoreductase [Stakelama sp. W311]WNO52961.1 SDR family oxidoreductase [Stakelama sp. W311]